MLEVTIATVSLLMRTDGLMNEGKEFNELVYDQDKLKLKLLAICVIFVLLAVRLSLSSAHIDELHTHARVG
jgi:hypothetical protein